MSYKETIKYNSYNEVFTHGSTVYQVKNVIDDASDDLLGMVNVKTLEYVKVDTFSEVFSEMEFIHKPNKGVWTTPNGVLVISPKNTYDLRTRELNKNTSTDFDDVIPLERLSVGAGLYMKDLVQLEGKPCTNKATGERYIIGSVAGFNIIDLWNEDGEYYKTMKVVNFIKSFDISNNKNIELKEEPKKILNKEENKNNKKEEKKGEIKMENNKLTKMVGKVGACEEAKLTMDGKVVVRRNDDEYVRYDKSKGEIVNYFDCVMDMSNVCFYVPTDTIANGDIILNNNTFVQITDKSKLKAINLTNGEKITLTQESTFIGKKYYTKVTSLTDNKTVDINTLMVMCGEGKDMKDIMMMQMMQNGKQIDPILMYSICGGKEGVNMKDIMMMQMMSGETKTMDNNMLMMMMMMMKGNEGEKADMKDIMMMQMMQQNSGEINPMMMLLMKDDNSDSDGCEMKDIMMMQMMQQNSGDINPMMLMMMMDKGNSTMKSLLLMQMMNNNKQDENIEQEIARRSKLLNNNSHYGSGNDIITELESLLKVLENKPVEELDAIKTILSKTGHQEENDPIINQKNMVVESIQRIKDNN